MDPGALHDVPEAPDENWWDRFFRRVPFARSDLVLVAALFLGSFVFLYPRRALYLNTTDSFLFALGTEEYDLERAHPHPPGYPVFVFLARLATMITRDENAALVLISLTTGALSVALLYGFLREFASAPASIAASLLFLVSPNLVYNSALALSYTAEGALSIGVAWTAVRVREGRAPAWLLGGLFGLALGVRPSSLFFLSPIAAWALSARPWTPGIVAQRIGWAAAGALPVAMAWFVPMLVFGGGFELWWELTSLQSRTVVFAYTIFNAGIPAVEQNLIRLGIFFASDIVLFWVTVAASVIIIARSKTLGVQERRAFGRAARVWLAWSLPAILFFVFVFSGSGTGPRGYALTLEPALFAGFAVLSETAIILVARSMGSASSRRITTGVLLAALLVLSIPLSTASEALLKKEVRDHDVWSAHWLALRDEYSPDDTAIFASHSWAFTKWYLPEYTVWSFMPVTPDPAGTPYHFIMESHDHVDDVPLYGSWLHQAWKTEHPVPPNIKTVILFDFQLAGENDGIRALRPDINITEDHLSSGWRILRFDTDHGRFPTVESMVYLDDTTPQPR